MSTKKKDYSLTQIRSVIPFARGKRGLAFTGLLEDEQVLLKKHNPEASVDTISHEANMLVFLNKHDIGPEFLFFENNTLVREFIEGVDFLEYLTSASKQAILRMVSEVFDQCRVLDLLGVNKLELTRPYKHILITNKDSSYRTKGSVVQIDFERAKKVEHPKNVTQFIQCVCREKVRLLLEQKNITVDTKKLFVLSKEYKNSLREDVFESIVTSFNGFVLEKSFSERVYRLVTNIPCGRVTTYKLLANTLGVNAYQAIGQALKNNPYSPRVPCHRVVKSDGSIGGFFGSTEDKALLRKQELLAQEGIVLNQGFVSKEKIIEL